MQHLKKILRSSAIQIWTGIESFIHQKFWKNWSLWFSPQKMCKFLSNSVRFLDSHSRYAQNDSFTLSLTSFLKKSRIFRTLDGSCKKWQPISQQKDGFNPPAPIRVKNGRLSALSWTLTLCKNEPRIAEMLDFLQSNPLSPKHSFVPINLLRTE